MTIKQYLVDQAITARNRFEVSWPLRRLRGSAIAGVPDTPTRFAIVPADMGNAIGSMGDLAMLTGLLQSLRTRNPDATFTIIGTRNHNLAVPGVGDVPVMAAWVGRAGSIAFDSVIRQNHALFVMGADILDGKYGAALVARIVDYCNHSVLLGIPATTLGFSFNSHPRSSAVHALSRLHPRVTVNVRDQLSLDRFQQATGISATLCADSAFLMPPATAPEPEAEAWISSMRETGRSPVGVNLNVHALQPALSKLGMDALIAHLAQQLRIAGETNKLAFMLIPHDLKPQSGDAAMLQALEKQLRHNAFPHVRYTLINRPDAIKRVTGLLDLVFTGRMHLAIASLGSGTPTLSITYQDKFEGLYQHFGLPIEHTITPMQCLSDALSIRIGHAHTQRHDLRKRICTSLPQVMTLASRNLVMAHN